jgi:O-antigen/teichoic acid export membrane protein
MAMPGRLQQVSRSPVLWSWMNSSLSVGSAIIVLPLVLRLLSTQEIGLWYVFLSLGSLTYLVSQSGISQSVLRASAYFWSGLETTNPLGVTAQSASGMPNWPGLLSLHRLGKRLYSKLSAGAFLLLLLAGSPWIGTEIDKLPNSSWLYASWVVYALGVSLSILSGFHISYVQGIGDVAFSLKTQVISRLVNLFSTAILLLVGGGVASLAAGALLSSIVLLLGHSVRTNRLVSSAPGNPPDANSERVLFGELWPTTWRFGLVSLGGWGIFASGTLVISRFLGLAETAHYGLTLQIIQLCSALATGWTSVITPRLTQLRATSAFVELRLLFVQRLLLAIVTYWLLVITSAVAGPAVLTYLHSNAELLQPEAMLFMSLYLFLELNHSYFATLIMSENRVPFVPAALISGFLIISGSAFLAATTALGVWSVLLVQGGVQGAFNNWYWVWKGIHVLRLNVREFSAFTAQQASTMVGLIRKRTRQTIGGH